MRNLASTADRLRAIRKAQEHFLVMFALECIFDQSAPYDRLARDLAALDDSGANSDPTLSRHRFDR